MRALQSSIPADPDLEMFEAKVGDRFLLCSDGLTNVVTDETLRMTLAELTDLDAAADQLVDLAIRSGGPDNITCVLADVVDTDDGQQASLQSIIVGALTAGDDDGSSEPMRSDSPAARAHQLAQAIQQAEHGADPGLVTGPLPVPAPGRPRAPKPASSIPARTPRTRKRKTTGPGTGRADGAGRWSLVS